MNDVRPVPRFQGWLIGMILAGMVLELFAVPSGVASARGQNQPQSNAVTDDGPPAGPAKPVAGLPWNRTETRGPDPGGKRLSSAREMLSLFNVGDSELRQFVDGRPLVADEEETLWKVLLNMPRFGLDKLNAWRRDDVPWQTLAEDPDASRFEIFALRGRAQRVTRRQLPPEAAERMKFKEYFQVDLILDQTAKPVTVFSRQLPDAWRQTAELDERVACLGLFLKSGSGDESTAELFFTAERIAWLPDRPNPPWGIGRDEVLLGDLGVDVGLLDAVRQSNGRPLVAGDREPFYQILAATGRASQSMLLQQASRQFDLGQLLNQPEQWQGRLLAFFARARRVQKIMIDDPDIHQRLGIDHYYQIDLQIPLGDQEVRLVSRPGETDGPVFRNFYPAHCNVLQLPEGLTVGSDVDQQLLVAGFYFKLWAYRTEFVQRFGQDKRQLGPLFLAVTPQVVQQRTETNPLWGWIGGGLFLMLLVAMAGAIWIYQRSDRRVRDKMRSRRASQDPGPTLDALRSSVQDEPDFNHLKQDCPGQ